MLAQALTSDNSQTQNRFKMSARLRQKETKLLWRYALNDLKRQMPGQLQETAHLVRTYADKVRTHTDTARNHVDKVIVTVQTAINDYRNITRFLNSLT